MYGNIDPEFLRNEGGPRYSVAGHLVRMLNTIEPIIAFRDNLIRLLGGVISSLYFPLDSQVALQDLARGCPTNTAAAIAHLAPTRAQILPLSDIFTLAQNHPNFL